MEKLIQAKTEFEQVLQGATEEEKKEVSPTLLDQAQSLNLIVYAQEKDYILFDQTINTLPQKYLYNESLIQTVCETYIDRDMPEVAYSYINRAYNYYDENGVEVPELLDSLKEFAISDRLIERVRIVMGELRNLPHTDIPKVLPSILNGKKKIHEFILCEILNGLKIMRKKIKAVTSIVHEDNFNDIFLATLRLRLQLWGWAIHDQERTGPSVSGLSAGEADITVKAGGNDITVIEALKMNGGDFSNLQKHILKCIEYIRDLRFYFIVVYYYGQRNKFDEFYETYKADVERVGFDVKWAYDGTLGFVDLKPMIENVENFHISKTIHGKDKYELYHVIIDLSKA